MTTEIYGGFWRRLFAFLIDKTIIYALSITICVAAILAVGLGSDIRGIVFSTPDEMFGRVGAFMSFCVSLSLLTDMLYFTLFHGITGQTPGKMLFHLHVTAASGGPITKGTAFLRWVGYLISAFFFFLGFLWIAFDRKKQGWHDKIALTSVVNKSNKPAATDSPYPEENKRIPAEPLNPGSLNPDPADGLNIKPHPMEAAGINPVADDNEDEENLNPGSYESEGRDKQ